MGDKRFRSSDQVDASIADSKENQNQLFERVGKKVIFIMNPFQDCHFIRKRQRADVGVCGLISFISQDGNAYVNFL